MALVSSNVGISTGTVGATLLGCLLPLGAAAGMVVANALGVANTLDYTVGATRATRDCG